MLDRSSSKSSNTNITKIIDIANKLNPNIKIYQMTLDPEAFRLKGEAVNL